MLCIVYERTCFTLFHHFFCRYVILCTSVLHIFHPRTLFSRIHDHLRVSRFKTFTQKDMIAPIWQFPYIFTRVCIETIMMFYVDSGREIVAIIYILVCNALVGEICQVINECEVTSLVDDASL